jgi:hypothetical protein
MSKIQREDNMFTQDARLEGRVANLELYRRLAGSGGGAGGSTVLDTWHVVGASGEPAYKNSWGTSGASTNSIAGFRKDPFGKVMLRGAVKGGANATVVFTLPVGYRPPKDLGIALSTNNGASTGLCSIQANGDVWISGGVTATTTSWLDGIEFDTETASDYPSGPPGPAGTPGPAGIVSQGIWSAATAYAVNDAVTYQGSWYRRKVAGTTAGNPSADPVAWELIVSKGTDGAPGATGTPGLSSSILPYTLIDGAVNPPSGAGQIAIDNVADPISSVLLTVNKVDGNGRDQRAVLSVIRDPQVVILRSAADYTKWTRFDIGAGGITQSYGYRYDPIAGDGDGPGGKVPLGPVELVYIPEGQEGQTGAEGDPGVVEVYEQPGTPSGADVGAVWIDTDESPPSISVVTTTEPIVTLLPSSPVDGQVINYLADAANGIVWRLRYRSAASGSYKWEFVGGSPLRATGAFSFVVGTINIWVDIASTPSITPPLAGDYDIDFGAYITQGTLNQNGRFGVINQATPIAPQDIATAEYYGPIVSMTQHRSFRFTGVVAAQPLKLVYYATKTDFSYGLRYLQARPVRVG